MTSAYCSTCGTALAGADAFCRACGTAQGSAGHDHQAAYAAGIAALQQGRRGPAVEWLTRAAAEAPDAAPAWLALGTACRQAEQWEAAEAHLRRSLALAESGVAWAQLGLVLLSRYAVDDAREALDRAVALAPEEFSVRGCRAEFFWRLGFWLDAIAELEAAARYAPDAASLAQTRRVLADARQKAAGSFSRGAVLPPVQGWVTRLGRRLRALLSPGAASRPAVGAAESWVREAP